jgi:drug/metabolite transporter (DMT)-like permease
MAQETSLTDSPSKALPAIAITRPFRLTRLDLALIFAMSLWGGNFVVSKAATDILPPLGYNAIRFTAASISMFILLRLMNVNLFVPRREWWPIVLSALIGNGLYQPFFINGLHETSASNAVLIITAGPIYVVLFNAIRSQERITRGAVLGVILAVVGVLTVIIGRYAGKLGFSDVTIHGDLLMVGASILWAGSILSSRRPLVRNPHLVATFWTLVCGACFQIILGAPQLLTFDWSRFTVGAAAAIFYSGVISVGIGSIVFNYAVNKLGTSRASLYTYLQPLVAATLAVLVLGEPFTILLVIGGILIFMGVGLARKS